MGQVIGEDGFWAVFWGKRQSGVLQHLPAFPTLRRASRLAHAATCRIYEVSQFLIARLTLLQGQVDGKFIR
jgi:hypothetical protein